MSERDANGRFPPGTSGNPGGRRPKMLTEFREKLRAMERDGKPALDAAAARLEKMAFECNDVEDRAAWFKMYIEYLVGKVPNPVVGDSEEDPIRGEISGLRERLLGLLAPREK